jgi:putative redox protein
MADPTPPMAITLEWDHALEFTGQAGRHEVSIDGNTAAAPSPMQYLALAVTSCMAIDIVHILQRGRSQVKSLRASFSGERSAAEPRRFTAVSLHFTVGTDAGSAQVERAIQLSREKYCSVMTSLREDIAVEIGHSLEQP